MFLSNVWASRAKGKCSVTRQPMGCAVAMAELNWVFRVLTSRMQGAFGASPCSPSLSAFIPHPGAHGSCNLLCLAVVSITAYGEETMSSPMLLSQLNMLFVTVGEPEFQFPESHQNKSCSSQNGTVRSYPGNTCHSEMHTQLPNLFLINDYMLGTTGTDAKRRISLDLTY